MADFPLAALRDLLAPPARTQRGIVVRVTGTHVGVATRTGLVLALAATTLYPRARVIVRDGVAWPAARATRRYAL